MSSKKDDITRETLGQDNELVRVVNRHIMEVSDLVNPDGHEHLGSLALHFYARLNSITQDAEFSIVTQKVKMNISHAAVTALMPEIKDRIYAALGAEKQRLAPMTVEETRDTGGQVIQTRFDR